MPTNNTAGLILAMRIMVDGKWTDCSNQIISGKSLRQICEEYTGLECVAKTNLSGSDFYLCGTDTLKRTMLHKGKAMTFAEAVELLSKAAADVLERMII